MGTPGCNDGALVCGSSKSETATIAAIEQSVPLLVEACEIIAVFHVMIRTKAHADLDQWLDRASMSLGEDRLIQTVATAK